MADTKDMAGLRDILIYDEGFDESVYTDTNKKKYETIGFGHKLTDEEKRTGRIYGYAIEGITREQLDDIFDKDIEKHVDRARSKFSNFDSMSPSRQNAVVNMEYRGEFERKKGKKTKTEKLIAAGDFIRAADESIRHGGYIRSKKSEGTANPITGVYKRMDRNRDRLRDETSEESEVTPLGMEPIQDSTSERVQEPIQEPEMSFEDKINATPVAQEQDAELDRIRQNAAAREESRAQSTNTLLQGETRKGGESLESQLSGGETEAADWMTDTELPRGDDEILTADTDNTNVSRMMQEELTKIDEEESAKVEEEAPAAKSDSELRVEQMMREELGESTDLDKAASDIETLDTLEGTGMGASLMSSMKEVTSLSLSDEIEGAAAATVAMMWGDEGTWLEHYNQATGKQEEREKELEEANPLTSFTGTMLGGVTVLPQLAGRAGLTALGGFEGYGRSTETTLEGQAKDVAEGAVAGLVGREVGVAAIKGLGGIYQKVKSTEVGSKAIQKLSDATESLLDSLGKKKAAFQGKELDEFTEDVVEREAAGDLRGMAEQKSRTHQDTNEIVYSITESDDAMKALLMGDESSLRRILTDPKDSSNFLDKYIEETDSFTTLARYGQDEAKELNTLRKKIKKEGRPEAAEYPKFEDSQESQMQFSVASRMKSIKSGEHTPESLEEALDEVRRKAYDENKVEYEKDSDTVLEQDITKLKREMGYARLQTDVVRYMHWATGEADYLASKYANKYKPVEETKKYTAELFAKFQQARKSGAASRESFHSFKQSQYVLESIGDVRDDFIRDTVAKDVGLTNYRGTPEFKRELKATEKAAGDMFDKEMGATDLSLQGLGKYGEAHLVMRDIDVHSKLDLEMLQNSVGRAMNKKAAWDAERLSKVADFERLLRGTNHDVTEVYNAMRDASKGIREGMDDEIRPLVNAAQEIGYDLLEASRAKGLDVADLGEYYLPERKLAGAQYVRAMEGMFAAVKGDPRFVEMLMHSDSKLEKVFKLGQEDVKDIAGFVAELKKVIGKPKITTTDVGLFFEKDLLRNNARVGKTLEIDAAALHTRAGDIPEFLLEKDVGKLFKRNITEAGTLAFVEPIARQFDGRAGALRAMGKNDSAKYVEDYRKDITGQYRESRANSLVDLEQKKLAADTARGKDASAYKEADYKIDETAAMLNTAANSIYPNLVGMNPAAVTRNLLQPVLKTVPELQGYDPAQLAKLYYKAGKKLELSITKVRQSDVEGITNTALAADIADTNIMLAASKSRLKGIASDGIKNFNRWSMAGFSNADAMNRMVTAEIGEDIAKNVRLGDLDKIKHFPMALKARALRVARNGKDFDPEFTAAVQDHLLASTQLMYGVAGNSQFVRDSNKLMGMMSKWPTAILTDVHLMNKYRAEYNRYFVKYMGPLLLVGLPVSVLGIVTEDADETTVTSGTAEMLLGTSLGSNMSPTATLLSLNFTPPVLSGVTSAVTGMGSLMKGIITEDERAQEYGGKQLISAAQQFVPVVGGAWRLRDRIQHAFKDQEIPGFTTKSEEMFILNPED